MTASNPSLRVYLVDDEPLAIRRLTRLLRNHERVEIAGSANDPEVALGFLKTERVDVVFLDIQMPGMNGFELLAKLPEQPIIIFTTAYDRHALRAFEVNSIDYLLKPISPEKLDRALRKVISLQNHAQTFELRMQLKAVVEQLALRPVTAAGADRIPSRIGDRIVLIELRGITHFFSKDKTTYAATEARNYIVDFTISELEKKLGPMGFERIHRATLINLSFVDEIHRWFGRQVLLKMKDKHRTELSVSRDHVKTLRERLALR